MSAWLEVLLRGATGVLALALLLSLYRLARGPSLTDRAVALDLFSLQAAGLIAVFGIQSQEPVLLDVALMLAIIGSLGTIVIARYLYSDPGDEP